MKLVTASHGELIMKEGEGIGGSPTRDRRNSTTRRMSVTGRRGSTSTRKSSTIERHGSTTGGNQYLGAGLFIVLQGGMEIALDSAEMHGRKNGEVRLKMACRFVTPTYSVIKA